MTKQRPIVYHFNHVLIKGSKFRHGARIFIVDGIDKSFDHEPITYYFHEHQEEPEPYEVQQRPSEKIHELIKKAEIILL